MDRWRRPVTEGGLPAQAGHRERAEGPSSASTWSGRSSPTHFLALPISQDKGVVEAIERVQVMQLDDEDSVSLANNTLCSFTDKLEPRGALQLHAKGLSHFRNQVLFLDIAKDGGHERLQRMAEAAQQHFVEAGVVQPGATRAFTPHITIAKISNLYKQRCSGPRCKSIPQEAWAEMVDVDGGTVQISHLQLCKMQGRQAGFYYPIISEVSLADGASVSAASHIPYDAG